MIRSIITLDTTGSADVADYAFHGFCCSAHPSLHHE